MKLCVSGCSFSNTCTTHKVTIPYGKIVADYFGYKYVHNAVDAGSNERIWRTTTKMILNKELQQDDILLIQYTIIDRREFWSPVNSRPHSTLFEPYEDGSLYRYHTQTTSAVGRYEKALVEVLNRFSNVSFNEETFVTRHNQFLAFLQMHGMKKTFLVKCGVYGPNFTSKHMITDYFLNNFIDGKDFLDYPELLSDNGHLNQLGHEFVAKRLITVLEDKLNGK